MAYSDFTLRRAEAQFGLTTNTDEDYFAAIAPVSLRPVCANRWTNLPRLP